MLQSQYIQHCESFITIDPNLSALDGQISQPEKLVEANETLKRIGLPKQ